MTTHETEAALFSIPERRAHWFDELAAQLRIDTHLETGAALHEEEDRYNALIGGNPERLLLQQREMVTRHFITRLVVDFILLSRPHRDCIVRIAAIANDSDVLVWIELCEDDELLEDQLTDVEAQVNAKYHRLGYDLEMMIVEEEDGFDVPSHYALIHPNIYQ